MSIVQRRIARFQNTFRDISLENYFGIINDKNKLVFNILHNEIEEEIIFTIKFRADYKCYDIVELPIDISRLIASYNEYFINIQIKISFPQDYPFTEPTWILLEVEDNIVSRLNLFEYFTYMVDNHNNQYKRDFNWRPIIEIEKDVLEFIQKINHFDYILEL
jgi:hypothetical protein